MKRFHQYTFTGEVIQDIYDQMETGIPATAMVLSADYHGTHDKLVAYVRVDHRPPGSNGPPDFLALDILELRVIQNAVESYDDAGCDSCGVVSEECHQDLSDLLDRLKERMP